MSKKNKTLTSDKNGPIEEPANVIVREAIPSGPYARMSWVGASDGHTRPRVEATGYAMDKDEWEALRAMNFEELKNYLAHDDIRRKQIHDNKREAEKIAAQKAKVEQEQAKLAEMTKGA